MTRCPGCGAEVDAHMTQCWECHETIGSGTAEPDDSDFDDDDFDDELEEEDDDLLEMEEDEVITAPPQARKRTPSGNADLEDAADALLTGSDGVEDDEEEGDVQVPDSAVVAYVAQDEVQAGAISQLLSDCGIRNFAIAGGEDPQEDDSEGTLQVQVMKEDLAAARQVIADFTSEFDDFS